MSALNSTETDQLRAVKSIIDSVRRDGYDPEGKDAKSIHFKKALEQASTAVHTITQMKGYYPLMTDIEHKRKKAEELIDGNNRSYLELKQATNGRFDMDTSDVRRELFIEHLVLWGIISEEQKLDFDIAFLEKVEEALMGQWAEFRKSQQPKLTIAKQPVPKLTDVNGRPLE